LKILSAALFIVVICAAGSIFGTLHPALNIENETAEVRDAGESEGFGKTILPPDAVETLTFAEALDEMNALGADILGASVRTRNNFMVAEKQRSVPVERILPTLRVRVFLRTPGFILLYASLFSFPGKILRGTFLVSLMILLTAVFADVL